MIEARRHEAWSEHLREETPEEPQVIGASCPSNNPHGIECPCVDGSLSSRLKPSRSANLILVPSIIIGTWAQEARKYLTNTGDLGNWHLRCGYTGGKMKRYLPVVSTRDREMLERLPEPGPLTFDKMTSSTVVITTKGCYDAHVRDIFTRYTQSSARQNNAERIEFRWGRVVVNEAYAEWTSGCKSLAIVHEVGAHVQKWLVSGTPFETGPDQMMYWVKILEQN